MPLRWDFKMDLQNCTLMTKRLTLLLNSNCSGVTKAYIKYISGIVPNDWSAVDIAGEAGGGDTLFSMRNVYGLRLWLWRGKFDVNIPVMAPDWAWSLGDIARAAGGGDKACVTRDKLVGDGARVTLS